MSRSSAVVLGHILGALADHEVAVGQPTVPALDHVAELISGRRGLIVAGRGAGDPDAVGRLADVLGWPVLGEP